MSATAVTIAPKMTVAIPVVMTDVAHASLLAEQAATNTELCGVGLNLKIDIDVCLPRVIGEMIL